MHRKSANAGKRLAKLALAGAVLLSALASPSAQAAADRAHGHDLYLKHCASCHGVDGRSTMPNAPALNLNQGMMQPDVVLINKLRMGTGQMPPFFGLLSDKDLLDVIAYLRTTRF